MNANELRIGNLIFSKETNEIQKITGITEENVYFNSITFDYPCLEEIEPIELTPEFLLKLGFQKQKGIYRSFYQSNDKNYLSICFDNDRYYFMDVNEDPSFSGFNYVHQIQNLYFALTGTELAYENQTK